MQLIRRNLHLKLLLGALVVIGVLSAIAVNALYQSYTEEQTQKYIVHMNQNLSRLLSSGQWHQHFDGTAKNFFDHQQTDSSLDTVICRADGRLEWSNLHDAEIVNNRTTLCTDLARNLVALDQDYLFNKFKTKTGHSYFIYGLRIDRKIGIFPVTYYVVMLTSTEKFEQDRQNYLIQRIKRTFFVYLGLLALLLLTTRWTLGSLNKIRSEIEEIRAGSRESLSLNYERELIPLTESVNELLLNERQQTLRYSHALNDLAHSLKTRLALIQMSTQELNLNRETRDNLNEQILTMDQIIQYQLRRAVTGRHGLGSNKGTEPIPLIEKLLASLSKVYRHKKLQTRFYFDDDVLFAGDQGDLMELMGNLLDNAFKFAISQVEVNLQRRGNNLNILIEDDGPGIEPERRESIFVLGVRADSSGGQGIGLAVVTEIVDSYGGIISVAESSLGGAAFYITLPAS